jgi:DNA replication licensing factor MCM2
LDTYEQEGLDEEEYSDIDPEDRKAAEEELERKESAEKIGRIREPSAFMAEEFDENMNTALLSRHRALQRSLVSGLESLNIEEDPEELALDYEDPKGKLSKWIQEPRTVRWIRRNFKNFLLDFRDDQGNDIYKQRIREMCSENKQSLEISYTHLTNANPTIALWVADEPQVILPFLNEIAFEIVLSQFKAYSNIYQEIYVRIRDLPIGDQLRDLRHHHLNKLIKVRGVVTRRTGVYPQLKVMVFFCSKCGEKKGPIFQNSHNQVDIGVCGNCQSKGPFRLSVEETIYRNYQKITLQETPGSVPPGRVPRHKDIILLADLIDIARPGEEVEVTGIYTHMFDYSLNVKHGFPIFSTVIEAVSIKRQNESSLAILTDEDKIEIRNLAKNPNIGKLIIESIAPSIYGHKFIKTALALSMFGGVPKDVGGKHKIRGDINVLVLGDPGVAKSQFLKYTLQTSPRCVYTTGKGASAVGLTAGVHKDSVSKEWTLEGGALVLADKGLCLIDEFDKMNDHDRTSIHEAMEQQTISISKAGIIATLQARCAVIAVANPVKGRYDSTKTFSENVDLSDPILSRFDILCVVKDEVDLVHDHSLSTFVINSHIKNHPDGIIVSTELEDSFKPKEPPPVISQELLKKYILYARQYVHPKLSELDQEKIIRFYTELRQESQKTGGISITVRHIESLIRISESHARIHLRDHVRDDDVDTAISMLLESFLQSQKYAVARQLGKRFSKYLRKLNEESDLLFHLLNKLFRDTMRMYQYRINADLSSAVTMGDVDLRNIFVNIDQFENEAREYSVHDLTSFVRSPIFQDNFVLHDRKVYKKTF